MGARRRTKKIAKSCWTFTKWLVGWPLAFFGLVGVPDSLTSWSKIIDRAASLANHATSDPHVQELAAVASQIAQYVNLGPVRAALAIAGLSILVWRWRPFWGLRHRIFFLWRRALDEETWIARDKAIDLIRHSRWADSRRNRSEKPKTLGAYVSALAMMQNDPEGEERNRMFYKWCQLALDAFVSDEESGVRTVDDKNEYGERALRKWLERRYVDDVTSEFGHP